MDEVQTSGRAAWEQVCRRHRSRFHTCCGPKFTRTLTSLYKCFYVFIFVPHHRMFHASNPRAACGTPAEEQACGRNPPPDIITSAEIVVKTDTLRIAWFVNLTFWFFSFLLLPSAFSPLDEEKMMWLFYVIYFIFGYIQLLSLYNPDNPLDLVT